MDYSIEVDGISKVYKLYNKPSDRLRGIVPYKKELSYRFLCVT